MKVNFYRNRRTSIAACRNRGFTLIEILVALTILSIIIATVYGAFSGTVKIIKSGNFSSETQQYGRLAVDAIRHDLLCAMPSPSSSTPYFRGVDDDDGDPRDIINFVTSAYIMSDPGENRPESEICEVGYFLSEEHEGYLVRRVDITVDSKPFSGGKWKPISANIVGLNFQYYDGEQWLDQWDPEAEQEEDQATGLPSMVRVEVTVKDVNWEENYEVHTSSAVVLLAMAPKKTKK